jgi:hypothetical protein
MHVRELTKKVGQTARTGKVIKVHGDNVEVLWDDGHVSSLSGAVLQPIQKSDPQTQAGRTTAGG